MSEPDHQPESKPAAPRRHAHAHAPSPFPSWRRVLFGVSMLGLAGLLALVYCAVWLWPRLPDLNAVTDYRPDLPLRVYSAQGTLLGEFGMQRRVVVPYQQAPRQLKQAILAAEDSRFFEHGAIDLSGLARAVVADFGAGGAVQGASTITMQVARDFYLSPEKTPLRKLVEILLSYKIEHTLSKQRILELYINQVYLGQRAYGFGAAAQVYFGKSLHELSLAQIAVLAGLPQAPSAYNPLTSMKMAVARQHYVLGRMLALHEISQKQYDQALAAPLDVLPGQGDARYAVQASYAAELVRQAMAAQFGDAIYTDGYRVTTTLDDRGQNAATAAVQAGLLAYDRRTSWRGPEANLTLDGPNAEKSAQLALRSLRDAGSLQPAVVLAAAPTSLQLLLRGGQKINVNGAGLQACLSGLKPDASSAHRVQRGSILRIVRDAKAGWAVAQLPAAQAALVSLNPQTGEIQAWVGGYDFNREKFDHVAQAYRQPGSSFKPFIYSAAVDEGLAPSTVLHDAPLSIDPGPGQPLWQPHNYEGEFSGRMSATEALAVSDNVAAVRVVLAVGMPFARYHAARFGLPEDQIPPYPTMVLGAGSFTPLQMARAYAVFANGGYLVQPTLISKVENARGVVLYQSAPTPLGDPAAPRIISSGNAFLLTQMMQAVIQHGTGGAARALGRGDLAGKTGTTSNFIDAWFDGYDHQRVAVAWVGYNQPRNMGSGMTGAAVALPIWSQYMRTSTAADADTPWTAPADVIEVPVNPATGLAAIGRYAVPGSKPAYFLQQFPPFDPSGNRARP